MPKQNLSLNTARACSEQQKLYNTHIMTDKAEMKSTTLRMPLEQYGMLQDEARVYGTSVTAIILGAITTHQETLMEDDEFMQKFNDRTAMQIELLEERARANE